jgi:hypothetical protein
MRRGRGNFRTTVRKLSVTTSTPGVSDLNITHVRNRSPIENFLEFLNEQKIQSGYCPCNGRFPTARFSFRVWGRGPKGGSQGRRKFSAENYL